MKQLALIAAVCAVGINGVANAATVDIDWYLGISQAEASVTINVGDTVRWTWADTMSHSVTGDFFDSGILTGIGTTFEHTFESPVDGIAYVCFVHGFAMLGLITVVVPDEVPALSGVWPGVFGALLLVSGATICNRFPKTAGRSSTC